MSLLAYTLFSLENLIIHKLLTSSGHHIASKFWQPVTHMLQSTMSKGKWKGFLCIISDD